MLVFLITRPGEGIGVITEAFANQLGQLREAFAQDERPVMRDVRLPQGFND